MKYTMFRKKQADNIKVLSSVLEIFYLRKMTSQPIIKATHCGNNFNSLCTDNRKELLDKQDTPCPIHCLCLCRDMQKLKWID